MAAFHDNHVDSQTSDSFVSSDKEDQESLNPFNNAIHRPPSRSTGRRSRYPCPLLDKFPYEPIYTLPHIAQMASKLEYHGIDIALVGAILFHHACKMSGMEPMIINAVHSEVVACSNMTAPTTHKEKPSIPDEYIDYADVFDEIKSEVLPEHHSYDLKIDLEDGAAPSAWSNIPIIS